MTVILGYRQASRYRPTRITAASRRGKNAVKSCLVHKKPRKKWASRLYVVSPIMVRAPAVWPPSASAMDRGGGGWRTVEQEKQEFRGARGSCQAMGYVLGSTASDVISDVTDPARARTHDAQRSPRTCALAARPRVSKCGESLRGATRRG
jgi:hypothetical protein